MRIFALVTARKASKRFPRKNLAPFVKDAGGTERSLVTWTMLQALRLFGPNAYITTDDPDVAKEVYNAKIDLANRRLIWRPGAFASDESPSWEAIIHAAVCLGLSHDDWICLLQPTSPLRQDWHVLKAICYAYQNRTSYSKTVYESGPPVNWNALAPNGAVYCAPVTFWSTGASCTTWKGQDILMGDEYSIDIDTEEDLVRARKAWAKLKAKQQGPEENLSDQNGTTSEGTD